jgi:hypothetical protein
MPVDYKNGKIYKIVCRKTGEVYVGGTAQEYLSQRLAQHVREFNDFKNGQRQNTTTSFSIIERGDYYIELVESCPCNSRDELRQRERYWYDTLKCVNKSKPYVLPEKCDDHNRQYYQLCKEEILEKRHAYYYDNIESMRERGKQYRSDHNESLNQTRRERYAQKALTRVMCECGRVYHPNKQSRHVETLHHQEWANSTAKEGARCDCGKMVKTQSIYRHLKSAFHQTWKELQSTSKC